MVKIPHANTGGAESVDSVPGKGRSCEGGHGNVRLPGEDAHHQLIIREIQIKTATRHHQTPAKMAMVKMSKDRIPWTEDPSTCKGLDVTEET